MLKYDKRIKNFARRDQYQCCFDAASRKNFTFFFLSIDPRIVCLDDHLRDKYFLIWANTITQQKGVYPSVPVSDKDLMIGISDYSALAQSEFVDGKGFKIYKSTQVLTRYYNSLNFNEPSKSKHEIRHCLHRIYPDLYCLWISTINQCP